MAYFERTDIEALMPAPQLKRVLSDAGDGEETVGLFDKLADVACNQVDALVAPKYEVPFVDVIPDLVKQAAIAVFLASLYSRNGVPDAVNPWSAQANDMRQQLKKVGRGEIPIQANTPQAKARAGAFAYPNVDSTIGGDAQYRALWEAPPEYADPATGI